MAAPSIPILAFVAVGILVIYSFIIYPAFLSPLAKIPPAHWSSPFSPLWILWTRYHSRENREVHAAHQRRGPVIRLAPNELSVNDVGGLRTVYAGGFEKGQWYSIFDNYGVPCMFSSWHSRNHSVRKRMISNIYSKSSIHGSPAFARQAQVILYDRLLPIINSSASSPTSSEGIDVLDIWNGSTMDFITAYLFGLKNSSNFLQNEAYRRHWLSLYNSRKSYTFFPQELPRLTRFCKFFNIHLVPTWVDDANHELEEWTKSRVEASISSLQGPSTLLADAGNEAVVMGTLLAGIAKERKSKGAESILANETLRYPELSVASEMIDQLAAGHETSGIILTYISHHLSQNLHLQHKLRAELLTLSPSMLFSTSKIPNPKELDSLPLLHAIVMETLRVDAAIPGSQPRITPYPSCSLGKYSNIPGGVRVNAQAHSLHRNEEVFPDPEKWDYKRWMDTENGYSAERKRERDRTFWAFSSGGRMCIGNNFAMYELKLVIAAVYTNFTTYIVNDDGIEQMDGYTCGPESNQLSLRFEKAVE